MKVIICGGRHYKLTSDDIDVIYDNRKLISEIVSGMSGAVCVNYTEKQKNIMKFDDKNWMNKTDMTLDTLANTYGYDEILGADLWGAKIGLDLGIPVKPFPIFQSDWSKYGSCAGPRRNALMVRYTSENGGIIAFPGGRGTLNCCRQANDKGLTKIFVRPVEDCDPKVDRFIMDYHIATERQKQELEDSDNIDVDLIKRWATKKPSSVYLSSDIIKDKQLSMF